MKMVKVSGSAKEHRQCIQCEHASQWLIVVAKCWPNAGKEGE